MKKILKNKIFCVIAILALLGQSISEANPEFSVSANAGMLLQVPSVFDPIDVSFVTEFSVEYFANKIDIKKYRYQLVVPLPEGKGVAIYNFSKWKGSGAVSCIIRDAHFKPVTQFDTVFGKDGKPKVLNLKEYSEEKIADSKKAGGNVSIAEYNKNKARFLKEVAIVKDWKASGQKRIKAIRAIKKMWKESGSVPFDEMMGRLDLHNHTIHSDGQMTPEYVVLANWLRGVSGMSITDHNTFDAVPDAMEAARILGITFVPGIELTVFDRGILAEKFHCAAYWKGDNENFKQWLRSEQGEYWVKRISDVTKAARAKMKRLLKEYNKRYSGLEIFEKDVLSMFPTGAVKRTDLARVILKKYGSVTLGVNDIHETKEKFLKKINVGSSTKEDTLDVKEVKKLCSESGFYFVMVHPLVRSKWDINQVEELYRRHAPFFDGVEVCHCTATDNQMQQLLHMVDRLNLDEEVYRDKPLFITIGSDTHGKFDKRFGFNTSSRSPTGLKALEGSCRASVLLGEALRAKYLAEYLVYWGMTPKNHRDMINIEPAYELIDNNVLEEIKKAAVTEKRRKGAVFLLRRFLKRPDLDDSIKQQAKALFNGLRKEKFELPRSGTLYVKRAAAGLKDIFIGKESEQKTVTIGKKTYYNDEPKLQNYFVEICKIYTELLNLWSKRMDLKRKGTGGLVLETVQNNIQRLSEKVLSLSDSIEDVGHPYANLLTTKRSEIRKSLKRAADLIGKKNEPAACAVIIQCTSSLSQEIELLIRKRLSHYPNRPRKRFSSQGGVITMRKGTRVNVPVSSASSVNFRVYGSEQYEMISEAISSRCNEVASQIVELINLKEAVTILSTLRSRLKSMEPFRVTNSEKDFINGLLKTLKRARVPEKVIAYHSLETARELMAMEEYQEYMIDTALGITNRFLILRINELSGMIDATRHGKLEDLREMEDGVAGNLEYILASIRTALERSYSEEALNLIDRVNRDAAWKSLRQFINDPYWRAVNKHLGKIRFYISEGDLEEALRVLKTADKRIKTSKIMVRALRQVYDEYFDANLFGNKMTLKENTERVFLKYIVKAGLNKASPPERIRNAIIWRVELFQDMFVPYRVDAKSKSSDNKKIMNMTYLMFSDFIKHAYRDPKAPLETVLEKTLKKFRKMESRKSKKTITEQDEQFLRSLIVDFNIQDILELPEGYSRDTHHFSYRKGIGWVIAENRNSDVFSVKNENSEWELYSGAEQVWKYLQNMVSEKNLAGDLLSGVVSACLRKKVVFAFENGIAGEDINKVQEVIETLETLKRNPLLRKLLKDNMTVLSSVPENLPSRIRPYIDEGAVVFTFTRLSSKNNLERLGPAIQSSYVDIPENFPKDAYVPLPEIVAMSVGKYLRIFDILSVSENMLNDINISKIIVEDRELLFELLPEPLRIDTREEIEKRYLLLNKFLVAV